MNKGYVLSREQLLKDLYSAYYDARKHKRNKPYQKAFERQLDTHLRILCEELWLRNYKASPSSCFIIEDPKKREIFAAAFRDRIVHHLYYNYVHLMLERTFIHDSYSCIKGRGTHFGINRLEKHIQSESQNYTQPCYVLKIDIRGYFMHIDRIKLQSIVTTSLKEMSKHRISKYGKKRWRDVVDLNFILYLTYQLTTLDPIEECKMIGLPSDWQTLPHDKSLFYSQPNCGLPIGNLTSQLFSNVYMNTFDQYVKRVLRCRHYGRYVDDAYFVSCDREWLRSLIPLVKAFLSNHLGLQLHEGKTVIGDVRKGCEFLGAFLKPHRKYVRSATLQRMRRKIMRLADTCKLERLHKSDEQSKTYFNYSMTRKRTFLRKEQQLSAINSYLGVLGHYKSKRIQEDLFLSSCELWRNGWFAKTKKGLKYMQ